MKIRYLSCTLAFCLFPLGTVAETGARTSGKEGHVPRVESFLEGAQLTEGFADVAGLPAAGWSLQNNSDPVGTSNWFQGNTTVFNAHAGPGDSYLGANFNNVGGAGTISNWALTPEVNFGNDAELRFWTRTTTDNSFPDRLEVRLSTAGASADVGTTATSVGDFGTILAVINPDLSTAVGSCPPGTGGYPTTWCEIVLTNADGIPTSGSGRIAFRYFVSNGGPSGSNADYIGIDTLSYGLDIQPPPPPSGDDVVGFDFIGSVTGVSGNLTWASDMQMRVTSPEPQTRAVGGFLMPNDEDWDFQGSGSSNDGTYDSFHPDIFAPGTTTGGEWQIEFEHGFTTGATMSWSDITVTLIQGDGGEIELAVPDFQIDGGEILSFTFQVEGEGPPALPESTPVPVNSPWAMGFLVLLLAGLGLIMIRRIG